MREILFRGKRLDNGEWLQGDLRHWPSGSVGIHCEITNNTIKVYTETVGQYTGLTDKNGRKIFEGDIIHGLFLFCMPIEAVVTFQDGAFGLEWQRGDARQFSAFTSICNVTYEIVGNIYDNPELLKGGTTDGD